MMGNQAMGVAQDISGIGDDKWKKKHVAFVFLYGAPRSPVKQMQMANGQRLIYLGCRNNFAKGANF